MPYPSIFSLGTNGHAHDGSAPVNRWLDTALSKPGRCVAVAAGNTGQEHPLNLSDLGHFMGRIHTSGQIEAAGLIRDIEWMVIGNGIMDASENELEIWYGSQDRFRVEVKPPGMDWIGPVAPREFIENQQLKDGSFISIYNELFHPSNGCNHIGIFLSPNLNDEKIIGVPAGVWIVRIIGEEIQEGHYHGWIERDDPRPLGRIGENEIWNFPSCFVLPSNVASHSVNSLACGQNVLSVGNYDAAKEALNASSSRGPTRDGRFKPEIIAPGTAITAAKGFSMDDSDYWTSKSGTSMSSPYVCGVAGLMLGLEPRLTPSQIAGIMMRTSRPLPGSNYRWQKDAGFGVINPDECLKEAKIIFKRRDITTKKMQG